MRETARRRFDPACLLESLPGAVQRLWVGYSGGRDSHCLLHALAALRPRLGPIELRAVHINHGLSPHARAWAAHCAVICAALGVPLTTCDVDATPTAEESAEEAARRARYAVWRALLQPGDIIATAHHEDDQAETLLLQLLRGAGPKGLAAMPVEAVLGHGRLWRPLLGQSRAALAEYATKHGLEWVEDASNIDTRFDRNFLRHEILPRLQRRWPAAGRSLARSARHCGEAAELLDALADAELGPSGRVLTWAVLGRVTGAQRRNLLRRWLERQGVLRPSQAVLSQIEDHLIEAAHDAQPCVRLGTWELRRDRQGLRLLQPLPDVLQPPRHWDLATPLQLADGTCLEAVPATTGQGLAPEYLAQGVVVSLRQGGERCRPMGCRHSRTVKHLLQEHAVPAWLRPRLPLVFVGDRLAAIPGVCICEGFGCGGAAPGVEIRWSGWQRLGTR